MPTRTAGFSTLTFRAWHARGYRDGLKRLIDIAGLVLLAPLALPLVAVLILAGTLSGGPVFFGHWRVGRGGRRFRCWKFRSMVADADMRLQRHLAENPDAAREWDRHRKLVHDPRVTRTGKFLRRSSLDELPQLWNVFLGDMSLVGPRPVTEAELTEYAGVEWAYLSGRPGLTGLWQISGRNRASFAERVAMDLAYLRGEGAATDIAILLRTPWALVRRAGV